MYFQHLKKKIAGPYCLVHHGATIRKFSPVSTKTYVRRSKLKFPTICTEIWDLTKIDPFESIKKRQLILLVLVGSIHKLFYRFFLLTKDRANHSSNFSWHHYYKAPTFKAISQKKKKTIKSFAKFNVKNNQIYFRHRCLIYNMSRHF
jgi:hypothetical protein